MFPRQHQNTAIIETVFSTRSVPIYNKQGQLAVEVSKSVRKQLWFSHCELLLLEAGTWGRRPFGNLEAGERLLLEAATKQRQWRRDCGH
jgi:hypothetical protein